MLTSRFRRRLLGGDVSLLAGEPNGLALDFTDDAFHASTGHYGSARVKDTSTPANNYNSHPFGLLTYAGASKKWVRGPSGLLIESDPALTLPYEWDTNGDLLGIRVEEQRTNLLTYSEQFDNAAWTKTRTSITSDAETAPDGETTADLVVAGTDNSTHLVIKNYVPPSQQNIAISIFAKQGSYSGLQIRWTDDAGGTPSDNFASFDLTDGSVEATSGTQYVDSGSEEFADGWFRCWLVVNASAVSGDAKFLVGSDGSTFNFAGDGSSGIYIWGAQLEAGSFPTSYIQTADSTVTRAGDDISLATEKFRFNDTDGTLIVRARNDWFDSGAFPRLVGLFNSNDTSHYIYLSKTGGAANTGAGRMFVSAGTSQASLTSGNGSFETGQFKKLAAAYAEDDFALSTGGGAAVTDTDGDLPSGIDQFSIGTQVGGVNAWNGWISDVTYLPRRMSNTELQEITGA